MSKKELSKIEPTFQNLGGYINFEDYMFILMMLTTPRRNFEIAFRMFDLDGNGVVDSSEFEKVTETIMKGKGFRRSILYSWTKLSKPSFRKYRGQKASKKTTAKYIRVFLWRGQVALAFFRRFHEVPGRAPEGHFKNGVRFARARRKWPGQIEGLWNDADRACANGS